MRSVQPDAVLTYERALDPLPIISFIARPDGSIAFVSRAWTKLTGHAPEAALGEAYAQLIDPRDVGDVLTGWERARQNETSYRVEYRLQFADGAYRWLLIQTEPLVDAGAVIGYLGTAVDIDDRHRAEDDLRASQGQLRSFLDALPAMTWSADPQGRILTLDSRFEAVRGRSETTALGDRWIDNVHPDDRENARQAWNAAVSSGREYGTEFRVLAKDGTYRRHLVRAVALRDDEGAITRWVGINIDIESERQAGDAQRVLAMGTRLLGRTGAALVASLDSHQTLQNIADACIEEFASYCIIDIVDADANVLRTVAHRRPEFRDAVLALSPPSGSHPIAQSLRNGASGVVRIDDAWLNSPDTVDRSRVVRAMQVRTVIIVPVTLPDGTITGAMTLGSDVFHSRPEFTEDDVPFVREVGRRVGAAIANVRQYEREHRIAGELQAASLPAALPELPGIVLDAEYRPGSDEATIGGDWYDAFVLDDGRLVITVGDVLGHGLHAAVRMARLRQALQTATLVAPDPAQTLAIGARAVAVIDHETFATALVSIYDPATRRLTIGSAGHPGPLVRRANGTIEEYTSPGMMLGLPGGGAYPVRTVDLQPGDALVFYTDGLVEATHDTAEGERRLHDEFGTLDMTGKRSASMLVRRVLGDAKAVDDIAVVVARIT